MSLNNYSVFMLYMHLLDIKSDIYITCTCNYIPVKMWFETYVFPFSKILILKFFCGQDILFYIPFYNFYQGTAKLICSSTRNLFFKIKFRRTLSVSVSFSIKPKVHQSIIQLTFKQVHFEALPPGLRIAIETSVIV